MCTCTCMYACMCICTCTCTCICICICICIYVYIYIYIYIYICVYVYLHVHVYMYMCLYMYMYRRMYVCTCHGYIGTSIIATGSAVPSSICTAGSKGTSRLLVPLPWEGLGPAILWLAPKQRQRKKVPCKTSCKPDINHIRLYKAAE